MICTKCKKELDTSNFLYRKEGKKNLCSWCKDCIVNQNKDFLKTKKGVLRTIYYTQITGSKKRNHELPKYNIEEFYNFALKSDKFNILYENWVKSGFEKNLKPSFDRINPYIGYSFDNIQLMTWSENNIKGRLEKRKYKKIAQYSIDNVFIKEFNSISEASLCVRGYKGNIIKCCKGIIKTSCGFIWKYV